MAILLPVVHISESLSHFRFAVELSGICENNGGMVPRGVFFWGGSILNLLERSGREQITTTRTQCLTRVIVFLTSLM
jgi:hypothetical protein